jgi:hypothetical protein
MAQKAIIQPGTGKTFMMGRRRPVARGPRFRLRNYLLQALPPPPASCDYSAKAQSVLSQVYLNDSLGDCVIAAIAHLIGVLTANATGTPRIFTDAEIIALYGEIGGYDPNIPSTDQGCDEVTALNWLQNYGAPTGSNQCAGWMTVDATNPIEVRQAVWLFENLVYAIDLPDAWINPMPSASGFTWDVAGPPDPDNGHSFLSVKYDNLGCYNDTWAMEGLVTDAANAAYGVQSAGGMLYTVLSPESIISAAQKAPNGFAWASLVADFDAMGGNVSKS